MAVIQLVMTGVPAFVGTVLGRTKVKFFIDETEFDPRKQIEVDLAKNTKDVPAAQWATDVDVDKQTDGGWTTIGPRFHAGPYVGAAYLSERLVNQYAPVLASWPPTPDAIYQYQAILRSDNGTLTRFHGFKVVVVTAARGNHAHLAFIRVGETAPVGGRAAARWIDLSDSDVSDPASNGFTTITAASTPGTVGALFLRSEVMAAGAPHNPKVPRGEGW